MKKKSNKFLSFYLVLMIVFSLFGCESKEEIVKRETSVPKSVKIEVIEKLSFLDSVTKEDMKKNPESAFNVFNEIKNYLNNSPYSDTYFLKGAKSYILLMELLTAKILKLKEDNKNLTKEALKVLIKEEIESFENKLYLKAVIDSDFRNFIVEQVRLKK